MMKIKLSMDEIDGRRLVCQESILHLSNHRSELIAKIQELSAELVNILEQSSVYEQIKLDFDKGTKELNGVLYHNMYILMKKATITNENAIHLNGHGEEGFHE